MTTHREKKNDQKRAHIFANIPDEVSLLAFGANDYSAGDVPKVPKAWELSASVR